MDMIPEIQLDENGFPRLSQPARRALAGVGIRRLEQLASFSEAEIKHLHGIGPNAMAQLQLALKARGLAFAGPKK